MNDQKILVVVDPTANVHPCIDKAERLAASRGGTLELFICDADQQGPEEERYARREQYLAMLEGLAAPLRDKGLHVTTSSIWHAPLEEGIVTHALRTAADLVVKDTHRHPLTARMPSVQTDWILIRQLPMPLLLVRPEAWPTHAKVAVSIDPCHTAERPVALDEALLKAGCAMGQALAGDVEVLHALELPPHLPGERPTDEVTREFQSHRRAVVGRLAHREGISRAAVHFVERRIPEAIVELAAQQEPNVLIMGAVRRSRLPNTIASTASQVLEQVACDVLVVKPPEFVSPVLVTDR